MAIKKEVLLANARNDGRGWGIAGRARNDGRVTYAGVMRAARMPPLHRFIRVRLGCEQSLIWYLLCIYNDTSYIAILP